MCKTGFGHLHTHSEYSPLDGAARIKELIQTAKELGQSFIAITDHGTTSGLWEAQKACDEAGIKLIMGNEFYYERENDKENGHLVILAKNNKGLENIFKLQEYSYVYGFHRKPRINFDVIKQHAEGLIITSSCLGSAFNQMIIKGDILGATAWARKFKELLQDDFYIELQPNNIPEQHVCNTQGIRIARQLGIKLVATNDVHYTFETDCFPHEVLLAMQTNKKWSNPKRFKFDTNDFWLKSEEEMIQTFDKLDKEIVLEAMRTTAEIADKCNARIEKGNFLPKFYNIPDGKTERQLLVEETLQGARESGFIHDEPYMRAVQNEIDVIDRNGYSGYFLVVADYVNSARQRGIIVGDGRGSGAGSKVAYLTGITKIEPSQHDLLFERFMADGRQPDFDVDFSDQDAVFEDLQRKYGVENVARIIAFGTATPKACVRKVLSVFEYDMPEINRITKMIDDDCKTMAEAYERNPQLEALRKKEKVIFDVIERLEGIVTHESQHAGGVIIFPNLSSILPIKSKSDDRTKRIVGWDKYMLEEIGHYKFDILGLETLPIVKRTLDSIKQATGIEIDLHKLDYDDARIYDMLCKGDVSGVFQINAQAAKVMQQQPRNFKDLIAINALIRPGVGDWNEYLARRGGKEWFKDPNRPWMHETLGIMTYQEQFLLDANKLCGWDIAYADKTIRKGKNLASNEEVRQKFISDGVANGHNEQYMSDVWQQIIEAQGDYSFNKSHAASYAMLSFQTAYLKCYYPEHFYASLMTSEGDDQSAIAGYVAECKGRGINILPPDINWSDGEFVATDDGIRYRITTIRHVGNTAINAIERLRPIASFADFMERREKSEIRANVVDSLIKAGCFDFDNPNRAELLWQVDMMNRNKTQIKNGYECPKYEWNDKQKAEWEKEALGMYLTHHPMERYGFRPLASYDEDEKCIQGGEVLEVTVRPDRKGNNMAFVTLDTLFGNVRVLVFSSSYNRKTTAELFEVGRCLLVRGRKSGDSILFDSGEELT